MTMGAAIYKGQELSTDKIKSVLLKAFPDFTVESILPNDHAQGNKSPCQCAGKAHRVFDKIRHGLYRVR